MGRRRVLEEGSEGPRTFASMNRTYPNIAAVFATMDRSRVAIDCVKSLAAQSRPPQRVIVADNVSSDGTPDHLEELKDLPFDLTVLRMDENLGNAGGVRDAMDLAFAEGADAVWILDDDSWPRPDALGKILELPWDPKIVRHPLQIDPQTGKFTWPMMTRKPGGDWHLIWDETQLGAGPTSPNRTSWTGSLLPREVYETVGPVNGDLFIRGEDEEYPWRIRQAGFRMEAVHAAVMDHPGPRDVACISLLGKSFFFEKHLADWKFFYKMRNMVWLKRKQSGVLKALGIALAYGLSAVWHDGFTRIPLACRAALAGLRGKLGRMAS